MMNDGNSQNDNSLFANNNTSNNMMMMNNNNNFKSNNKMQVNYHSNNGDDNNNGDDDQNNNNHTSERGRNHNRNNNNNNNNSGGGGWGGNHNNNHNNNNKNDNHNNTGNFMKASMNDNDDGDCQGKINTDVDSRRRQRGAQCINDDDIYDDDDDYADDNNNKVTTTPNKSSNLVVQKTISAATKIDDLWAQLASVNTSGLFGLWHSWVEIKVGNFQNQVGSDDDLVNNNQKTKKIEEQIREFEQHYNNNTPRQHLLQYIKNSSGNNDSSKHEVAKSESADAVKLLPDIVVCACISHLSAQNPPLKNSFICEKPNSSRRRNAILQRLEEYSLQKCYNEGIEMITLAKNTRSSISNRFNGLAAFCHITQADLIRLVVHPKFPCVGANWLSEKIVQYYFMLVDDEYNTARGSSPFLTTSKYKKLPTQKKSSEPKNKNNKNNNNNNKKNDTTINDNLSANGKKNEKKENSNGFSRCGNDNENGSKFNQVQQYCWESSSALKKCLEKMNSFSTRDEIPSQIQRFFVLNAALLEDSNKNDNNNNKGDGAAAPVSTANKKQNNKKNNSKNETAVDKIENDHKSVAATRYATMMTLFIVTLQAGPREYYFPHLNERSHHWVLVRVRLELGNEQKIFVTLTIFDSTDNVGDINSQYGHFITELSLLFGKGLGGNAYAHPVVLNACAYKVQGANTSECGVFVCQLLNLFFNRGSTFSSSNEGDTIRETFDLLRKGDDTRKDEDVARRCGAHRAIMMYEMTMKEILTEESRNSLHDWLDNQHKRETPQIIDTRKKTKNKK